MADIRDRLEQMASRGEHRDVDAVVAAAFDDANAFDEPRARATTRARGRIAVAIVAVAAMLLVVVVVSRRNAEKSLGTTSSTSSSPPRTTFASTDHGWVDEQGVIRDLDGNQVATFPMKGADAAPVRVAGGFVAVLADHALWFVGDHRTDAVQWDTSVSGVAASADGVTIAYSKVSPRATAGDLFLLDVGTGTVRAHTPVDRFVRVVGETATSVVLETGDGAASSAAFWDPTSGSISYPDGFGTVGGVGRDRVVLHQGDGTCPALLWEVHGSVSPVDGVDLNAGADACVPIRWSFDVGGSNVAGFGFGRASAALRVSAHDHPLAVGTTQVADAVWVDESTIAAIDDRGELVRCDVLARCTTVRLVVAPPVAADTVWLIAARRDGSDATTPATNVDRVSLRTVQMVSPSVVFAAGPGVFLRSDDGGATWRRMPPCADAPRPCPTLDIERVDMLSTTTGWAVTGGGLYRTVDGEQWQLVETAGVEHGLADVHFVSPSEGWGIDATFGAGEYVGLPDGKLVHTSDGGSSWTAVSSPNDAQSVCFTQPDDGWLVTRQTVYRSTDGGASWTPSYTSPLVPTAGGGIAVLQCAPGAAWVEFEPGGAAAGSSPYLVVASSDGGNRWDTVVRSPLLSPMTGPDGPGSYPGPFSVIDATTAVLIGDNPNGPATTGVLVEGSTNIGAPFRVATALTPLAVSFSDAQHGVVVGDAQADGAATIYVTNDGGAHWTPVTA